MLKDIFFNLMRKYTNQEEYILTCWNEIYKCYSSKTRYYHNLIHINDMISELDNTSSDIKERDSLLFAIYYHDIIYDISKHDNEHRSAMLFKKRIEKTKFKYIENSIKQIEATKEHKLSEDNDINILMDLDLAILGKSREEYRKYSENIRKEYYIFSEFQFRNGRKNVINKLLDLTSIYKTTEFKAKYEERARANLNSELKLLD